MIWYRTPDMDLQPNPEPELRLEALREAVDHLPNPQDLIVSLRFFGASKTFKQIAEETGLTVYQVKGILDAGLVNLRNMLEGHDLRSVLAELVGVVAFDRPV